jgi:hypothetical protein
MIQIRHFTLPYYVLNTGRQPFGRQANEIRSPLRWRKDGTAR